MKLTRLLKIGEKVKHKTLGIKEELNAVITEVRNSQCVFMDLTMPDGTIYKRPVVCLQVLTETPSNPQRFCLEHIGYCYPLTS